MLSAKARISAILSNALWGVLAGVAALAAFGFFTAALFVWITTNYDSLTACLVLGGIFAAVAVLAMIIIMIRKRNARQRAVEEMLAVATAVSNIGSNFERNMKGPQGKYYLLGALAAGWLLSKTFLRR
jgi:hypothetical protein